ncbi:MAG: hybrid sensor histidine kinase/response regulator [Wenzhouxiangellaceae bacterium]|nr:MAG: hybrid sensor histidine kinase/response regulator [Wenzhouxiangellaceae bacterium]
MNRIQLSGLVLAAMAWLPSAFAELVLDDEVRFQRISMAHGLSQSSIHGIAQCRDGFLWFGTQFGLDRFDGYRFVSWRHDPADAGSLSHSAISDLKLAGNGLLWVATRDGLNRFDTRSGRAERFPLPASATAQGSRSLRILGEAVDERLYLEGSDGVGVWRPETQSIHWLPFAEPVQRQQHSRRSAVVDQVGRFWLLNGAGLWVHEAEDTGLRRVLALDRAPEYRIHSAVAVSADGLLALALDEELALFDPVTETIKRRVSLERLGLEGERTSAVHVSSDGALWLFMSTHLVRYWPGSDRWELIYAGGRIRQDENTRQRIRMVEHPNGDLWFTSQYGVARWSAATDRFQVFNHDPRDSYSIPPTTLGAGYVAFVNEDGSVWVGSRLGGLARYSASRHRFQHIADRSALGTVPFAGLNIVRGIAEQRLQDREYLWLALDHGGLRRMRRRSDGGYETTASFHALAEPEQRLPGNAVWGVLADPHSSMVWVLERYHLVGIDATSNQVVTQLAVGRGSTPNNAMAWSAGMDRLWLATSAGLRSVRISADRRELSKDEVEPVWPGRSLMSLLVTANGQVLAGARDGVGLHDPSDPGASWFLDGNEHFERGATEVYGLAAHHESGWWLGTREFGLAHLDWGDGEPRLVWYGLEDGLVDMTIYAILPQEDGQLWMSGNNGLMRWDPGSGQVRHFTMPDGIQSLEFNNTVAHVGADGAFFFGGINGVNRFMPGQVAELARPPRLHLQEISVRGQPWRGQLHHAPALILGHDQNDIEIAFVGLQFSDPTRVRYAYRLAGLDDDWVDAGNQRQVRYAGLAPGRYRFYARAANSDGVWSEERLLVAMHVRPPPWQTGLAYTAYTVIALGLLFLAWLLHLNRRKELEALVQRRTAELARQQALSRRQALELERALEARTLFFANVSHEFRTPLTLIQASLDQLDEDGGSAEAIASGRRYLRHLLRLVDQLLDLSRLRLGEAAVQDEPWTVAPVVAATAAAFRSLAEQRDIRLRVSLEDDWMTRCSQTHVEKILLNLLTNALKFSPGGGEIEVTLKGSDEGLELAVRDTGPGIPEQDQERIFERFQRLEWSDQAGIAGAGIGLALVREASLAMGGSVGLTSQPGCGSRFSVHFPGFRGDGRQQPARLISMETLALDSALLQPLAGRVGDDAAAEPASARRAGTLLLVEDHADLRAHICRILKPHWQVLEAADGDSALALARCELPDLIISDIMMPGMDGFALLAQLRNDLATSHIPVLLLTARQDQATRLKGLSLSADDFLAKPFDATELVLRLRRMLDNRERLRRRLQGAPADGPSSAPKLPDLIKGDVEFLAAVRRHVAARFQDPGYGVEQLAEQANVERRTLQRKLKAMTGLTPAAFIRHQRLQHAMALLESTELSVNQIALDSGFASAQHFTRLFSKQYGSPPQRWRQERQSA